MHRPSAIRQAFIAEALVIEHFVWSDRIWVVGLRRRFDLLEFIAHRHGQSLWNALTLSISVGRTASGRPLFRVVDIAGNGYSKARRENHNLGIGHLLANLAIEYLQTTYPSAGAVVSGQAFHTGGDSPEERERRLRFIRSFGLRLDESGCFRARLEDLTIARRLEDRGGPPGTLSMAMLRPRADWPEHSSQPTPPPEWGS